MIPEPSEKKIKTGKKKRRKEFDPDSAPLESEFKVGELAVTLRYITHYRVELIYVNIDMPSSPFLLPGRNDLRIYITSVTYDRLN